MAHTKEEKKALLEQLDKAWEKRNLTKGMTKSEIAELKFKDPEKYGIPSSTDSLRYTPKVDDKPVKYFDPRLGRYLAFKTEEDKASYLAHPTNKPKEPKPPKKTQAEKDAEKKKTASDPTKGMTVAQKALYRQGGTEEQFAKLDSTNLAKSLPEFKTVEMKAEEAEKNKKKPSELVKELTDLKIQLLTANKSAPELVPGIQAEIDELKGGLPPVDPNIVPDKVKEDPVGPDFLHEWWGKRAEKAKILEDTRSKFEQQILNDETFKSQMPEKYQVNGLNAYKYWAKDLADAEISDTERREKNEKDPLNLGI